MIQFDYYFSDGLVQPPTRRWVLDQGNYPKSDVLLTHSLQNKMGQADDELVGG